MNGEINQDLARVCVILGERGNLQRIRHSTRNKYVRYQYASFCKAEMNCKKKLEKLTKVGGYSDYKLLTTIEEQVSKLKCGDFTICDRVEELKGKIKNDVEKAKASLEEHKVRTVGVSSKILKLSIKDLKIGLKESQALKLLAEVAVHKHSKATTNELRALLKKNGWSLYIDASNICQRIRHKDVVSGVMTTIVFSFEKIRQVGIEAAINASIDKVIQS